MTEKEVVDLAVERLSCLETIKELGKNDGYMNTVIGRIIDDLQQRADAIKVRLEEHFTGR